MLMSNNYPRIQFCFKYTQSTQAKMTMIFFYNYCTLTHTRTHARTRPGEIRIIQAFGKILDGLQERYLTVSYFFKKYWAYFTGSLCDPWFTLNGL